MSTELLLRKDNHAERTSLLVERLGVGGGGGNVGVAGSLVGAGGELEGLGSGQVGVAGGGVHSCVLVEVEVRKLGEHFDLG